ncbi:hypothetical protein FACS189440_17700 [Bacteroidia bacterium]|nr:hypothetical protein FACS189423_00070 [Bacteroidia bacterium]GHT50373.1 hypothetical protein FACS189440_17700 [Bacteroidia bacterium]
MKMKKMIFLMLTLLIWGAASMNAQVTIGSENPPHAGAILDLQSDTHGLLFTRISLTDADVFQLDGNSDDAIGMTVYNTNTRTTNGYGAGLYCWDGSKWSMVGKKAVPECSGLYVQFGTWTGPKITWLGGTHEWQETQTYFSQTFEGLCVSRSDFRGHYDEVTQHCADMDTDNAAWRLPNIAELNYLLKTEDLGMWGSWAYWSSTLTENNHTWCASKTGSTNWTDVAVGQTQIRDSRCVRSM